MSNNTLSPKKKISLFLALTLILSLLSYIPIIATGQVATFSLTLMWSPGVAALLTQLFATRSLRGLGWRFGSARWLGLAYILPVLYGLPVYAIAWLTGLSKFQYPDTLVSLSNQFPIPISAVSVAFFILVNATFGIVVSMLTALGEEIGWRGLFVPELAKVTSFTKVAMISGTIWTAWHMPAIFLGGYKSGGSPAWFSAACFAILAIALSFPFAWITLKSGSLWPAALLHASHNLFIQAVFDATTGNTGITPYITGEFGIGLAVTTVVVAYIFWRKRQVVDRHTQQVRSKLVAQPE